jgi:hypothetical protein
MPTIISTPEATPTAVITAAFGHPDGTTGDASAPTTATASQTCQPGARR